MAEARLFARAAFGAALPAGRLGRLSGEPGLVAREIEVAGAAYLLGGTEELAAALAALDLALPAPRRWTAAGEWQALWVGPERWLLLGPDDAARVLGDRLGTTGVVVDQSDARAMLSLRGPAVRDVLARMLAVDVHPRAFGTGDVAVTLAGHIGCIVWQVDDAPEYRLAVARSYAGSLARWLVETAVGFGLLVEA